MLHNVMRSNHFNHTYSPHLIGSGSAIWSVVELWVVSCVFRIDRVTLTIVFMSSSVFMLLYYFQDLVEWFWPLPSLTTIPSPRLWPAKVHGVLHFSAERVVWGQPFWKLLQHLNRVAPGLSYDIQKIAWGCQWTSIDQITSLIRT